MFLGLKFLFLLTMLPLGISNGKEEVQAKACVMDRASSRIWLEN